MEQDQVTTIQLYELIKGLIVSTNDIKQQITQSKEDIKVEIHAVNENLSRELKQIKQENEELKKENKKLKEKLQRIEKATKKHNLIVYNLEEQTDKASDLKNFIEVLRDIADISCTFGDFRDFYRLGREETNKVRPASVELASYFLKEEILNNAKKLKDKKIYVSLDYPKEEYLDRKILRKYQQIARSENKTTEIKNYTLFVDGDKFTPEDLRRKEAAKENETKKKEEAGQKKGSNNAQKRKPDGSPEPIEERNSKKTTLRSGRKISNPE